MATEWVHAEAESVAADCVGNRDYLFRGSVLKAALNEEVPKSIDHQGIRLIDNGFNDVVLLFSSPNLQFLLKEDRRLLIVAANDFVDYVFPVTGHALIKETAVVQRFKWRDVGLVTGGVL